MEWLTRLLAWLNDPLKPGRKRGIAAVAGALSVLLRTLGYLVFADAVTGLGDIIINILVPGVDIITVIMALWGWISVFLRSRKDSPFIGRGPRF